MALRTTKPTHQAPQSFKNGEIHDWYRIVLGYSDHLVADLLQEFNVTAGQAVLDPFSGSGTTAVECRKRGVDCWAIDANPIACYATRVKTAWTIDRNSIVQTASTAAKAYTRLREDIAQLKLDPTAIYVINHGMVKRGWISHRRLYDAIALKHAILDSVTDHTLRDLLLLAAMNEFVHTSSTVRFGPELYCGKPRSGRIVDVFLTKVEKMATDLAATISCLPSRVVVSDGDSRNLDTSWVKPPHGGFDAVITSPPYPTEHDYTRNARLELAFLEHVRDRESLRVVKRRMVRSHTKGIYSTDNDHKQVSRISRLRILVAQIEAKAATKDYGFARLYGTVTKEYFGGMRRHFRSLRHLLKPGAHCAYVVGDQSSYLQVRIPTADLLADLAQREGFKIIETRVWRERWATSTRKFVKEHILILKS